MTARRSVSRTGAALVAAAFVAIVPGAGASSQRTAAYPANSTAAPFPSAVVPIATVSNGCGPGEPSTDPRYADDSEFVNSNVPFLGAKRYLINFRDACDMHDAGYSGAEVADKINGGFVDYFGWTKAQVDEKFLADMRRLCDTIPAEATIAREDCKGNGGYHTVSGAYSRYRIVLHGYGYRARPELRGLWANKAGGVSAPWAVSQNLRAVTANWHGTKADGHPLLRGHFEGTLITHDPPQADVVEGTMTITEGSSTATGHMSFTLSREGDPNPDEFVVQSTQAGGGSAATLVDDRTPGRYAALGNALNGRLPQFPATKNEAGPTLTGARAPNLSPVSGVLGAWLQSPPSFSGSWSGPRAIPPTWPIGSEDAIVYELDGPITGAVASFGVDNGLYVWVNGAYRFGALAPGGVVPGEYTFNIGDLPPGKNYVQIIREDHGGRDGYTVQIRGTQRPSGPVTLVREK